MATNYVLVRDDVDQAAALQTVGVDFASETPGVSQTTRENGKPIDREVSFFLAEKTRDGRLETQLIRQAWDDVVRADLGDLQAAIDTDALTRFRELAAQVIDEESKGKRDALMREMDLLLPCVMVTAIRLFTINREHIEDALETALPKHERLGKISKYQRMLREAVKRKAALEKIIAKLNRKLSQNPPPKFFPRVLPMLEPEPELTHAE